MTRGLLGVYLVLFLGVGCATTTYTNGVPNFGTTPGATNVFHSGQPETAAQWAGLRELLCQGRATCRVHIAKLNRPSEGSDDGGRAIGFDVRDFAMHPYTDAFPYVQEVFLGPDDATIARLQAWIDAIPDTDNGVDVYDFHCVHGWDRTMRAVREYLVRRRGWTTEAASDYASANGNHWIYFTLNRPWPASGKGN